MKLQRRLFTVLVAGLLTAACGGADPVTPGDDPAADPVLDPAADDDPPDGDDVLKVAFVYVGDVGDAGWAAHHDVGRRDLEAALGDRVETTHVDRVPEGPDSEEVFEDLARAGNELIFGTSYGYGEAMVAVSGRYPDVVFEHAGGDRTTDNLGTYVGAVEQTRYLEGMAAGAASETGQIGYVAAFPIPEVIRGINAYTLGAQAMRPDATVQVVWTSTWYDPDVERDAATSLIDSGADVIGMHQDSPAPGEVAEAAGAKWTGSHTDLSASAPGAWLTASVWNWGPFYTATAESVLDGTWDADRYAGGLADGLVTLAPFGESVSEETRTAIEARRVDILDGSFAPFTGPIQDQSGEQRVAPGDQLDPDAMTSFDWFVAGVLGDIG